MVREQNGDQDRDDLTGRQRYETDPVLTGRKVEAIFDPFDLTEVEIRWNRQSFGIAKIHQLGAHVHPKATVHLEQPDDMPPNPGIDYIALVEAEHRAATGRAINFANLPAHDPPADD